MSRRLVAFKQLDYSHYLHVCHGRELNQRFRSSWRSGDISPFTVALPSVGSIHAGVPRGPVPEHEPFFSRQLLLSWSQVLSARKGEAARVRNGWRVGDVCDIRGTSDGKKGGYGRTAAVGRSFICHVLCDLQQIQTPHAAPGTINE